MSALAKPVTVSEFRVCSTDTIGGDPYALVEFVCSTSGKQVASLFRLSRTEVQVGKVGGSDFYTVNPVSGTCTCPDAKYTPRQGGCKHLRCTRMAICAGVLDAREV